MMGASLSLAVKSVVDTCQITGIVHTEEEKQSGVSKNTADRIFTENEFLSQVDFSNFDLIVIALPVNLIDQKL